MKKLLSLSTLSIATALCLLIPNSAIAEPIPARDPFSGESRPDWWWDIWHSQVVVLEGNINFEELDEPDVSIKLNKERIKEIIPDDKTRELQSKLTDFYVGELKILKVHYVDGGVSHRNKSFDQMRDGDLNRLKVLIPIMKFVKSRPWYGSNLEPDSDNIGIHVFDYSELILGLQLAHSSVIPKESLADAQQVFEIRNELVNAGVNTMIHPDRGFAGFSYSKHKDVIIIDNVLPETPAEKSGLKPGDTILSINGENLSDQNDEPLMFIGSMVIDWEIGDEVEIEVERKNKKRKFKIELISSADLKNLNSVGETDKAK